VMGQQQRRSAIFQTVCLTVLSYWVVRALLFLLIAILDPNTFLHHSAEFIKPGKAYYLFCLLDDALSYTYLLICAIQLRNVRSAIRKAYKIPASFVGEDTCYRWLVPAWWRLKHFAIRLTMKLSHRDGVAVKLDCP
jgi:hypothetical protein